MYFDIPTQVAFYDVDGFYRGGIAYKDEIICGCCGGIYEIDEVLEDAAENDTAGIILLSWHDINNEIKGEFECE